MARPGALMRRVLASNPTVNVSPWFQVCDRYSEGLAPWSAAARCLCWGADQDDPAESRQALVSSHRRTVLTEPGIS
jgi:hypothetical protein